MQVNLSLLYETEDLVRDQLYGRKKREDCAEWDGDVPTIPCDIPEENIVNGIVTGYKGELVTSLYLGGSSPKTIRFDPNWSVVSF